MKKFTLSVSVLASVALAGCQIEDGTSQFPFGSGSDADNYTLTYSLQADRSGGASVQNAALESDGQYYFYLDTTNTTAGTVQFFVNGTHVNSDSTYPYDMNGGSQSAANVQDMSVFSEGSNKLIAKIDGEIVSNSEFMLETVVTEPDPQPEPEPEPEPTPSYSLVFSTESDRSGATDATGNEFNSDGVYYFFLDSDTADLGAVEFLVNGNVVQTEYGAPYDMAGGAVSSATAQDMSVFVEGENEITVTAEGTLLAQATITLSTATEPEPEPEPEPQPEPDPTDTIDVTLYWNTPQERENGETLDVNEIGGYEIRYRLDGGEYQSITINDGAVDQHLFTDLTAGDYEFQIATFDTDGVYSEFVAAQ